jgi:single-strand DNA-binding protein
MAGSVNKVILVGNLGRDPEVRNAQDGRKIVNLSVATSDTWRDKATGERKERTEWHRVVIFNERLAEVASNYLRKGSRVYLEGQLQTRKWTDNQSGQEKYSTEVVLQNFRGELQILDSRGGGGDRGGEGGERSGGERSGGERGAGGAPGGNAGGNAGGERSAAPSGGARPRGKDFDDDIPF